MSVYEKGVEFYIDILQRDQLDETVNILEKSVVYFKTVYPVQRTDCPSFVADHAQLLAAVVKYVIIEVKRIKVLMDVKVGLLLKQVENQIKELELHAKIFKKRLQKDGIHQIPRERSHSLHLFSHQTFKRPGGVFDVLLLHAGAPPANIQEALHAAVDSIAEFSGQGIQFLANALATIQDKMAGISTVVHNDKKDFDATKTEGSVPPSFSKRRS